MLTFNISTLLGGLLGSWCSGILILTIDPSGPRTSIRWAGIVGILNSGLTIGIGCGGGGCPCGGPCVGGGGAWWALPLCAGCTCMLPKYWGFEWSDGTVPFSCRCAPGGAAGWPLLPLPLCALAAGPERFVKCDDPMADGGTVGAELALGGVGPGTPPG